MAKGSKSSAKKPRKKSKLLTFRTPQEKRQLKLKQNSASSLLTPSKHGTDAVSVRSIGKTANNKITISTPKKSQERKRDRESDNLSSSKKTSSEISMDAQNNETRKKTMNATPINANNDKAGTMKERKRNTPEISQVKQNKATKIETQTKRKKRQSINFIAPKDRRSNIRNQSMTGHTLTRGNNFNSNGRSFNISASSISQLSDTPGLVVSRSDSQASQPIKESISSTVQPRTSQKRKLADDKVQTPPGGQAKKRKTSKKPSPNDGSSSTTASTTRGKRISKRSPGIPVALDRIRDLRVTKKSFEKWKLMSKVTIAFVENILKSVILNVSADGSLSKDEESERCLSMLRSKVMERLPNLKAPHTKGDYAKMELENKLSEDVYLEKTKELNALDKKIEEEQRLLETQLALVAEYTMKREEYEAKLEVVEEEKAHPLIKQTKTVLNLPKLPDDFCVEDEAPSKKSKEEVKLCNTLLDLRRTTKEIGLDKWMDKLSVFTKKIVS